MYGNTNLLLSAAVIADNEIANRIRNPSTNMVLIDYVINYNYYMQYTVVDALVLVTQ